MTLERTMRKFIYDGELTLKQSILGVAAGLGLAYAVHGSFHMVAAGYHKVQSERAGTILGFNPETEAYVVLEDYTGEDAPLLVHYLQQRIKERAKDVLQRAEGLRQYHLGRAGNPFYVP